MAGGLFDKDGVPSFSLATVHGIRKEMGSLGIGLSYDIYESMKVFPVTLIGSIDVIKVGENRLFLQFGGGYAWLRHEEYINEFMIWDVKGGLALQSAFGYRITTEKLNVYILAGYKYQEIAYEQAPRWWIWGPPSGSTSVERQSQRVVIQVGFGFH
ncbi:MAG TPA: hypothetical protein VD927_19880 [Chryseosolibacter sp.]|nr:hypothetical protein [Chryseosolibacter sp.]